MLHHLIKALAKGAQHAPKAHKTAAPAIKTAVRAPYSAPKGMWVQSGKIVSRHKVPPGI